MIGDERKGFGNAAHTLDEEGSTVVVMRGTGVVWRVRWLSTRDRMTSGDWAALFSLTEYIQPVCLPAAGQALVDGKVCTVTGWGNTQFYGEFQVLPVTPLEEPEAAGVGGG